jgi:hypothetical protein
MYSLLWEWSRMTHSPLIVKMEACATWFSARKGMKDPSPFLDKRSQTKNGRQFSLSVEKEIKDSFLFLNQTPNKMEVLLPKLFPKNEKKWILLYSTGLKNPPYQPRQIYYRFCEWQWLVLSIKAIPRTLPVLPCVYQWLLNAYCLFSDSLLMLSSACKYSLLWFRPKVLA